MARNAFLDKSGMTLIEIMMALILLAIVSVALIQSTMLAMHTNLMNELRDEAVSVAAQRINQLRNMPFSAADMAVNGPAGAADPAVQRSVRGVVATYALWRTVSNINAHTRQVTLAVEWSFKGKTYRHSVSTVVMEQ